jgi:vacuolar-type H+-ATPase subunit I/STV1
MLPSEDDLEEQQQIEEKSREYEQMLKERQKINKDKVKKAKAKLKSIQNAQKIEKKMAKEAKKFGLPPPPSLYTQEDIDRANQELKSVTTLPNLTTEQKAECMTLLNEALDLRDRAEELGRLAQNVPGMTSRTREAADKADKAMDKYEKTCTQ